MEDKNIIIYHHNDLDGRASAAIILSMYHAINPDTKKIDAIKCIEIDYKTKVDLEQYTRDDIIYFVDYSFTLQYNIDQLFKATDDGKNITWIDHHTSSVRVIEDKFGSLAIDTIRNYVVDAESFNTTFSHFISEKCSATMLCYIYAIDYINKQHLRNNTSSIIDYWRYLNHRMEPKLVKMVDDYDTFKFEPGSDTHLFYYWALNNIRTPMDFMDLLLHAYGKNIFNMTVKELGYSYKNNCFLDNIIKIGGEIKSAEESRFEVERKSCMFEFTIEDRVHDIKLRCLGMNIHSNSMSFGEKYFEYDAVCPFFMRADGDFKYSLFSDKSKPTDLSFYAELIGKSFGGVSGGGHTHACGFIHEQLLIKPGKNLVFDKASGKDENIAYFVI